VADFDPGEHCRARVDGKPTQRHIAYLAGFTESAVATSPLSPGDHFNAWVTPPARP
jgi:hypothetical protein